jgi:hypothetical protein
VYSENARSDAMRIPLARCVDRGRRTAIRAIGGSAGMKWGNLYMHIWIGLERERKNSLAGSSKPGLTPRDSSTRKSVPASRLDRTVAIKVLPESVAGLLPGYTSPIPPAPIKAPIS